jgi:hypothetical protein
LHTVLVVYQIIGGNRCWAKAWLGFTMIGPLRGPFCALAVLIAIAVSSAAAFEATKLSSWIPKEKGILEDLR